MSIESKLGQCIEMMSELRHSLEDHKKEWLVRDRLLSGLEREVQTNTKRLEAMEAERKEAQKENSSRGWQVILTVIGALVALIFGAIPLVMKIIASAKAP